MVLLRTRALPFTLALAIAFSGCGDDGSEATDSGAGGKPNYAGKGGGGASGSIGVGGSGGISLGTPLLERPGGIFYKCGITRAMAKLNINPWNSYALVGNDDTVFLARVQGDHSTEVLWSTINLDGLLGSAATVARTDERSYVYLMGTAVIDDRFTLLWGQTEHFSGDQRVLTAQVNDEGSMVGATHELISKQANQKNKIYNGRIIRTGSGYVVAWSEGDNKNTRLWFVFLDKAGIVVGTPKVLVDVIGQLRLSRLIATRFGFAMTYAYYARDGNWTARYQALDTQGDRSGPPYDLPNSEDADDTSLLARGNEVLVAWTGWEGELDGEQQQRQSTVRLSRIDGQGSPVGPTYALQAPIEDEHNITPRLVDFGQDIGLLWGHGHIAYVCGGCMPDDTLHFVLLDGQNFTPTCEVVTFVNPAIEGGLVDPEMIVRGDDVLVVSSIGYHTVSEGASGTIRCTK